MEESMNWKKVAVRLAVGVALLLGAAHSHAVDQRNFWCLNNTGKEIRNFYVSAHESKEWGSDILGRATLLDGMGTVVYFNPNIQTSCNFDFKLVYADGSSQTYTAGRNVCAIHAVQYNSEDSIGF
jgi:hypothetical protein